MRTPWISLVLVLIACGDKSDSGGSSGGEGDDTGETSGGTEDVDGDGYDTDVDCNDGDAAVNPGATEICNEIDDDCDGDVDDDDEGLDTSTQTQFFADADEDGFGSDEAGTATACTAPSGYIEDSTDCDDFEETVYPDATEICDGKDNDCDGLTDDDDVDVDLSSADFIYADQDADGYGDAGSPTLACEAGSGYVEDDTDCNDLRDDIYPGADEVCDGADNDCNDSVDDDAVDAQTWYLDGDGDTYGTRDSSMAACQQPSGHVPSSTDCDDSNDEIHPAATEVCNDVDDDCDGAADDNDTLVDTSVGGTTFYDDDDGDGYGDDTDTRQTCDQPSGYVDIGGDCDDTTRSANPAASEICDGIDNDCDGDTDDADSSVDTASGGSTFYADDDNDGYGDKSDITASCDQPSGYVSDSTDCDDSDDDIHPGAAEVCNDVDDDCDKKIDDYDTGLTDGITWYRDFDGDDYGYDDYSVVTCDQPSGYVQTSGDCDDSDDLVNPGADEICDDEDNNCDGNIDSDAPTSALNTYYADDDRDGYGSPSDTISDCDLPSGYVENSEDCDDTTGAISPDGIEYCDSKDNDCDGDIDDADDNVDTSRGGRTYYADNDTDNYGNKTDTTVACAQPSGYVTTSNDCDDTDGSINPGATEVCNDVDDDCDNQIDDNDPSVSSASKTTYYADTDRDGYGVSTSSLARCDAPTNYVADSTDCDDRNSAINPAATEICDNKDNDCDTLLDDGDDDVDATQGGSLFYADQDVDGYGDPDNTEWFCIEPSSHVSNPDDCDDTDDAVHPDGVEVCDDADNDCDDEIDEAFIDEGFDATLIDGVSLNGDADRYFFGSDGYIELTSTGSTYQVGSVMISEPIPGDIWYASFDIYIGGGTGADGLGFVFYNADDVADTYYGTAGLYMGFNHASAEGYAVEFDALDNGTSNNDPNGNHIAVVDVTTSPYSVYDIETAIPTLETSSTTYTVEVYFLEGDIDVYIDGTLYLSTTITDYSLTSLRMGWTAATGLQTNYHTLDDIYVGCY